MRAEQIRRGVILYEKEQDDLIQEAVVVLAKQNARALSDEVAAEVGALFECWRPGVRYKVGERISDGQGNLYRVVQEHTSQVDWPIDGLPALYERLGSGT